MLCTVPVRHRNLSVDLRMDCEKDYIPDYNTLRIVTAEGTPEREVVDVLLHVLRPGDVAIDGGANIGYFTLLMAELVGDKGTVIAFEPGPDNVQKLRTNIALNGRHQVQVIEQPLWKHAGLDLPLYCNDDPGQHSLTAWSDKTTPVRTTCIDDWNVKPRLIKLDVEGAEFPAIKGAAQTIRWHQPFVVCEFNCDFLDEDKAEEFRTYMLINFGYNTFALYDSMPLPVYLPHNTRINSGFQNTNVLFATPTMVGSCWPEIVYRERP